MQKATENKTGKTVSFKMVNGKAVIDGQKTMSVKAFVGRYTKVYVDQPLVCNQIRGNY